MGTQRRAAFLIGVRGDAERAEDGDEGVIGHDHQSTIGVLVLSGHAITPCQLDER